MATYTLSGAANFSTISGSVNSNDTIALNGFALTLDVGSPTQTGVIVTAAGNTGTVVIGSPTTYNLTGWTFQAGTAALFGTIQPTVTINATSITGGSVGGAHGVNNNYGTVTTSAYGGSASGAYGVSTNNGTVTSAYGGSVSGAYGVSTNYATVTSAIGGSVSGAYAVNNNYGTVTSAYGGSVSGAYGVSTNYATVTSAIGGSVSGAYAVNNNYGTFVILGSGVIKDNAGKAIGSNTTNPGTRIIVANGSALQGVIPSGFSTIYYIGPINSAATIQGSPTLVPISSLMVTPSMEGVAA